MSAQDLAMLGDEDDDVRVANVEEDEDADAVTEDAATEDAEFAGEGELVSEGGRQPTRMHRLAGTTRAFGARARRSR